MLKPLRKLLVAWIVWEALVGIYVVALHLWSGRGSAGPGEKVALVGAFVSGFLVVLANWLACPRLRRIPSVLVGLGCGFLVPVAIGWAEGMLVDHWQSRWLWAHLADPAGLWFFGWLLCIPSAIAGALIGLVFARPGVQRIGGESGDRESGESGRNPGTDGTFSDNS